MNIESEASVKVAFEVFAEDIEKKRWMSQSFFNLLWDDEEKALMHCGMQGINSFDSLLKCPFISCYVIKDKEQELENYLEGGYSLILPISTARLGIAGKNFFHNIYVKKRLDNGYAEVFDFWPPKFTWKGKKWDIGKIGQGIVRNTIEHRYPIACKLKGKAWKAESLLYVNNLVDSYLNGNALHGISVYQDIKRWIEGMKTPDTLNHVVFVTLEEHFGIWENLLLDNNIKNAKIELLKNRAVALRNQSMKVWYSKRVKEDWKEDMLKRLMEIQELEEYSLCESCENI